MSNSCVRRQRGTALFVALMMLLLLTLGALAAMSSSILQERMVGATFQAMRAFQRAQERLADGERRAYEFVTGLDRTIFFASCEILVGQNCDSAGGMNAANDLASLLRPQLGTTEATLMCGAGDLMAMSTEKPPRQLGEAIEELSFQLTASAAVCDSNNSPIGALPVVVQSYYSP